MKGVFTISLDFELHWGGCEKWPLDQYREYFLNTRQVIPKMLELFRAYEIHVTWATVGMLFFDRKADLLKAAPSLKPSYRNQRLSVYRYIDHEGIGEGESQDPFHYGRSLVAMIAKEQHQEIGSHSFSHYYCNEEGQTTEQFREDLKAAKRSAATFGVELKSFVFPRNQFNADYLRVCKEEGIESVRSNPSDWFWKIGSTERESWWKRLNRGLDAYLPLAQKTYPPSAFDYKEEFPVLLPASRLLRPYRTRERLLNGMKLRRIVGEMNFAARRGEVYHLWWHPHNFGIAPQQNLRDLEKIIQAFHANRKEFGMRSLNMNELCSLVKNENGKATAA